MSVIDLGDLLEAAWRAPIRPIHIRVVTLEDPDRNVPSWAEVTGADASHLPGAIKFRRLRLRILESNTAHSGAGRAVM
jgi:hypothetical protein